MRFSRLFVLAGAAVIVLLLVLAFLRGATIEGFNESIQTPASDNFGIDPFKQEDIYSKASLQTVQLYPGKLSADLLMSQQKQRQYMMAVLNEKVEKATARVAAARKEVDKASGRLNLAREKTKQTKRDLLFAEITVAFAVGSQIYAASNFVTIDPTVAIRAAGGAASAAKALAQASIKVDDLKKYKSKMENEEQNFSSDLIEYTALAEVAQTELTKVTKEFNEAREFFEMSAESEYIRKKFFPFASSAAGQTKKECDDIAPRRG